MRSINSGRDEALLAAQETMATALQRLGKDLMPHGEADPAKTAEVALTVLATIRTWLQTDTLTEAAAAVGLQRLEEWEQELIADTDYVLELHSVVNAELRLPLGERNRRRIDLLPHTVKDLESPRRRWGKTGLHTIGDSVGRKETGS